jgi:hypothetical protein
MDAAVAAYTDEGESLDPSTLTAVQRRAIARANGMRNGTT